MISPALFSYEMKKSWKLLAILAAVMTMYITLIIGMFDPKTMAMLEQFQKSMPQMMAAVGMKGGMTTLIKFMISYLYGFILILFPLLFMMIRSYGLIGSYADHGQLGCLLAAPVTRGRIIRTQMLVLLSGLLLLFSYATTLEYIAAGRIQAGAVTLLMLLRLNGGLLCLQLALGGVSFLMSCLMKEARLAVGLGCGLPLLFFVLHMLANQGDKLAYIGYLTPLTLFRPEALADGLAEGGRGALILLALSFALFAVSAIWFGRKEIEG